MLSAIEESSREAAMAQKILKGADHALKLVDDAFIIQHRGHAPRPMPTFRPEEISLGKVLGMGGFGIVNEIRKFTLDDELEQNGHATNDSEEGDACGDAAEVEAHPQSVVSFDLDDNPEKDEAGGAVGKNNLLTHSGNSTLGDLHVHYDITQARATMKRRCCQNDTCRYALKRLRDDLNALEKARGMVDLAIEAKYLSVVWHPNIIKMRGMAQGELVHEDFFIILDRLHETLDEKINGWFKQDKKNHRCGGLLGTMGIGLNKEATKELLQERLTVSYDLAAAFMYLHENRLVYRDIKPENIGFDIRGDVKVFDFGLCKSLSPHLKAREGYGYRLTGRAGSLPYMAPEVINMETYDTKCDVYSFAILLWEILSLRQAFKGLSPQEFVERVVVRKERLHLPPKTPPLTRLMIPEAWEHDPRKRPDMKRVAILIRGDLNDMTNDDSVLHRTRHMDDRSNASLEVDHDGMTTYEGGVDDKGKLQQ